ncbi:SHOCT domain-containing protein [uncultured Methanobrevibacter sp.]|uniref:SHOCT domain-containing protein n=1 Tax=uncultured Methanobrevibacter sp. TaxID=253161 RepID=UPI0025F30CC9|nr:SHOCT domain-containing protein [uncultured Methanobrevibacter sp.]
MPKPGIIIITQRTYVIQFSPADELLKFADLLERGYISREEFDRKKEELLKY